MPIQNEFLQSYHGNGWEFDFTDTLDIIKKLQEKEKYDKVWELIKKKNGW